MNRDDSVKNLSVKSTLTSNKIQTGTVEAQIMRKNGVNIPDEEEVTSLTSTLIAQQVPAIESGVVTTWEEKFNDSNRLTITQVRGWYVVVGGIVQVNTFIGCNINSTGNALIGFRVPYAPTTPIADAPDVIGSVIPNVANKAENGQIYGGEESDLAELLVNITGGGFVGLNLIYWYAA